MELWSDLIPPLLEKYAALHTQRLQAGALAAGMAEIMRRYDAMCFEMVEGIHTLFIEMIRNQGYVRKAFPKLELDIYREAHLGMIAALKEALTDEVATLMDFAFHLQRLIQQLRGYCWVLRKDIKQAMQAVPTLQKDRRFRQINLQAQQALVAIDLQLGKAKLLSEEIARGQFQKALGEIGAWETQATGMRDLLAEMPFSEEEKAILRGVMGKE
jgi:hypothetical protein